MKTLEKQMKNVIKGIEKEAAKAVSQHAVKMARGFNPSPVHSGLFPSILPNRRESMFVNIPREGNRLIDRFRDRATYKGYIERRFPSMIRPQYDATENTEKWNVSENTTMILVKDDTIICAVEKVENGFKCFEEVFSLEENAILAAHEYIRNHGKGQGYKMIYFPDNEVKDF